ncbi:MAG: hypothetical protein AAGA33_06745 [Pseudomonadota bacterium]
MSIRLTIVVLALLVSGTSYAESFELDLTQIQMPATASGQITFKECETCVYQRKPISSNTRFEINGNAVNFDQFRRAANGAPNKERALVTVLIDDNSGDMTLVSVRIRNRAG